MDAAILIVIVDSGCKFHGGVIWPQRHFSLHAPPRRALSSNEFRDGSPSHLKFDRVRATGQKGCPRFMGGGMFAADVFTTYYLCIPRNASPLSV